MKQDRPGWLVGAEDLLGCLEESQSPCRRSGSTEPDWAYRPHRRCCLCGSCGSWRFLLWPRAGTAEEEQEEARPAKDGHARARSPFLRGLSGDSLDARTRGRGGFPAFCSWGNVLGGQVCRNAAACERHSCAWWPRCSTGFTSMPNWSRRHDCTLSQLIHSESTAAGLTGDGGEASGQEGAGWLRECHTVEAFKRRPDHTIRDVASCRTVERQQERRQSFVGVYRQVCWRADRLSEQRREEIVC